MLLLAATLAAMLLLPLGSQSGSSEAKPKKKGTREARPNVILVMTDDQAAESVRVMPTVNRQLIGRGVSFDQFLVSFPLCCPSRATMLTGQYPDNHGVRTNLPPGGGYSALRPTLRNTLPRWLQKAGYHTGHIGKFLNGYGAETTDTQVPPGWDEWYGSLDDPDAYLGGTYTMYGYTLNENGQVVHYGSSPNSVDPATYQTDVYADKAETFIRRRAPKRQPFFLSIASTAPHAEEPSCGCAGNDPRAAPRHEGAFAAEPMPRPPSFDEADVSDKPLEIRLRSRIAPEVAAAIENRYRNELESLLAVDDLINSVIGALKDKKELKNTVIIFTSDNGFFHGEHRIRAGKVRHYEEASRVPLIIRGPGVPRGQSRSQLAGNVDLAPTLLDLANAKAERAVDGISLMPLIKRKSSHPGRGILIEGFNAADPSDPDGVELRYSAARTDRYVYAVTGAEEELYDLASDPFQVRSIHRDPAMAAVKSDLSELLARLVACAGRACRTGPAVTLEVSRVNRCGVRVGLGGAEAGRLTEALLFANGRKIATHTGFPFEKSAVAGRRAPKENRLGAIVTMRDGRRLSLQRTIRGC